jgi:hypothetical protein
LGPKPNGLGFNFLQMDSLLDIGIAGDFTPVLAIANGLQRLGTHGSDRDAST